MHSISLNKAAENTRITLKSIESLTYSCTNASLLQQLDDQLLQVCSDFRKQLPSAEGLIIRPAIVERAKKTKQKYQRLKATKLPVSKLKKRKKDWKYRNRVGKKADQLREVNR